MFFHSRILLSLINPFNATHTYNCEICWGRKERGNKTEHLFLIFYWSDLKGEQISISWGTGSDQHSKKRDQLARKNGTETG